MQKEAVKKAKAEPKTSKVTRIKIMDDDNNNKGNIQNIQKDNSDASNMQVSEKSNQETDNYNSVENDNSDKNDDQVIEGHSQRLVIDKTTRDIIGS